MWPGWVHEGSPLCGTAPGDDIGGGWDTVTGIFAPHGDTISSEHWLDALSGLVASNVSISVRLLQGRGPGHGQQP